MKSTKVQTHGALYSCAPLINRLGHAMQSVTYLSQTSCVIVDGFRAALDLGAYPLSNLSTVH